MYFLIFTIDLADSCKDGSTCYDLVANIIYEGGLDQSLGVYKVHVVDQSSQQWYQIQDLFVDEIMAQMIILQESCIQIWKKQ